MKLYNKGIECRKKYFNRFILSFICEDVICLFFWIMAYGLYYLLNLKDDVIGNVVCVWKFKMDSTNFILVALNGVILGKSLISCWEI